VASVALVLARLLSPDQLAGWGWRVAFLIAAPIGVVGWYVRTRVLESPEFARLDRAATPADMPLMVALRTAKRGMLTVAVWMAAVLLAGYLLAATFGLPRRPVAPEVVVHP
jgi:MHS family proline/betaine transporter-like MFS transporter